MELKNTKSLNRYILSVLVILMVLSLFILLKSGTILGMNMLLICSLMIIAIITKYFFLERKPSATPAAAIVMAIGIFVNGAIKSFPIIDIYFGELIAIVLLICWVFIFLSYFQSFMDHTFMELHHNHPIKSFAIGTWIAGTSVVATVVYQRIPELNYFVTVMVAFNCFLWGYYVFVVLRNFKILFSSEMFKNAHGVLLLSCVSTQSLVVSFTIIFENAFLMFIGKYLIILGTLFYLISFVIIIRRYLKTYRTFDIDTNWFNTNCILHGAMSITGLASAISKLIDPNLVLVIWIWVLSWFVIVEIIEICRAVVRVKKHGFAGGLLTYDVSQWSRNFTFGMLYAFTMSFDLSLTSFNTPFLINIQDAIIQYGGWVVIFILAFEIFLFFKANATLKYVKPLLMEKGN